MKKVFLILPILAFLACSKQNEEPLQSRIVRFNVQTFLQSQESFKVPSYSPIYDEAEDGAVLTDIYAFDGTTLLSHQTSDQEDFGTIMLELIHGTHNLSFIATRSAGLSYKDSILSCTSLRSTFGKLLTLNVTGSTQSQDLTLNRINGQLVITINDAFPTTASEIAFTISKRYEALNIKTLCGIDGIEKVIRTSCTSKVGKSGESYNIFFLAPSLENEYKADVTITVYNSTGTSIYNVTVKDVRFAANTKTILSGDLFSVPSANISVNTSWNTSIVGNF